VNSIAATDAERHSGQLSIAHRDAAVTALSTDGFVVLENVIDRAHLATLRERMLEDVARYLARDDVPFNWNTGNLQQAPPPFPPYLFRDVLVNDLVIQVTKAIIGPRMQCDLYTGNTALPSETRQPVHFDYGRLWEEWETVTPAFGFIINVPVVATDPMNGSTEIWPGSHLLTAHAAGDIKIPIDAVEARRAVVPPVQPSVPEGGVLIRDVRIWHAGMPNRTTTPRPMIAMTHWIRWLRRDKGLTFPVGAEALLSHPDLILRARYTDTPIDHVRHGDAYEYER
jgi:ectoine hydroxylase-related dioxygenase (phytanoyl-CoA dioxygenase family)